MQILLDRYNKFVSDNIDVIARFEENSKQKKELLMDLRRSEEDPEHNSQNLSKARVILKSMFSFEKRNKDILTEYRKIVSQVNSMGLEAAKHFPAPELVTISSQSRYYIIAPRKVLIKTNCSDPNDPRWCWKFRRALWTVQRFSRDGTETFPEEFDSEEEACQEIAKRVEKENGVCLEGDAREVETPTVAD